ncbi:MAG TPA: GNAT family N-acetyltransferase, partial [Methyloceanibacter sp.]|nr:GNAT family N-acetyltransferase [Methyloceanibacter sp.]
MSGANLRTLDPREWDDLAVNAVEENPFLARPFVMAGLDAFGDAYGMQVVILRADGVLAGLVPFRTRPACGFLPLQQAQIALNLYQVHGAPLIRREHADRALAALLDMPGLPVHWAFPHVDFNGPFVHAIARVATARRLNMSRTCLYTRPVLTRIEGGCPAFVRSIAGQKREREIARTLRRLREKGEVAFERATDPALVAERLEAFLHIENAGWKGTRRTSFLARQDHAAFARRAFTAENGFTSVDSLLFDGKPLATVVNIATGSSLFTAKCAFDEKYRKFGPGLILEYLAIEHFCEGTPYEEIDSATSVDGHILLSLWNASKSMGTLLLGSRGAETALIARVEEAR